MRRRVVVTGLGIVSTIGQSVNEFWGNLLKGTIGVNDIVDFDSTFLHSTKVGQIPNFNPSFLGADELGEAAKKGLTAAIQAYKDASLEEVNSDQVGVIMGTTAGEIQVVEKVAEAQIGQSSYILEMQELSRLYPNKIATCIADYFGFGGPVSVFPTACSAGNYAIGSSFHLIQSGKTDVMLAGGTDSFSRTILVGFNRVMAVAKEKCCPFDKNRDGMIPSEGAAVLVLEELQHALKRNVKIYAEIIGFALSCDAYHITAPHPEGEGIILATEKALEDAGIKVEDVDYFCAHGTGTEHNDRTESLAVQRLFGDHVRRMGVSSIKSMLGHTMGAASAIEAIACVLSVKDDVIPPTMNFEIPDEGCHLNIVKNNALNKEVNIAVSNSYAFGGNNASLVIKKYRGEQN